MYLSELGPYMELPPSEQISSIYNEPYVEANGSQKSQEEADAELARMLQEEEGNIEECIMQRDRLLAIEAQDKELAKVLQERERIKAKKAKERARQKALAKKQQKKQEELQNHDVIMPDDAYSNPADMILPQTRYFITIFFYVLGVSRLSYYIKKYTHTTPIFFIVTQFLCPNK